MIKPRKKKGPRKEIQVYSEISLKKNHPGREMTRSVLRAIQKWINIMKVPASKRMRQFEDQLMFARNQNGSQSTQCLGHLRQMNPP